MNILIISNNEENDMILNIKNYYKKNLSTNEYSIEKYDLNNLKQLFVIYNHKYKIKNFECEFNQCIIDLPNNIYPWDKKYYFLIKLIKFLIKNKIKIITFGGGTICLLFLTCSNYFFKKFKIINNRPLKKINNSPKHYSNNNFIWDYSTGNLFYYEKGFKENYNIGFHYKIYFNKNVKEKYLLKNLDYSLYDFYKNKKFKNKYDINVIIDKNYNNKNFYWKINDFEYNDNSILNIHKIIPISEKFIFNILMESNESIEGLEFKNLKIFSFKFRANTLKYKILMNHLFDHKKLNLINNFISNPKNNFHCGFTINKNYKIIKNKNYIKINSNFINVNLEKKTIQNILNKSNDNNIYRKNNFKLVKSKKSSKRLNKSNNHKCKPIIKNKLKTKVIKINYNKIFKKLFLNKKDKEKFVKINK